MPRAVRAAAFTLLLASFLLGTAPARAADRLRLRVVTMNVWGLPWGLAPDREARFAKLGPALAALHPQLVALQEVWVSADGHRLMRTFAAAGLPYARYVDQGFVGSGLLVASAFPIEETSFHAYSLAGKPYKPWHADWYARKGVLVVRLKTPLGSLRFADTHLHARYGTDEYLPVQTSQALEAVSWLGDFGAHPPELRADAARSPLILAGDLNTAPGQLPFRLLTRGAALTPVSKLGIDEVLTRPGGALRLSVVHVRTILDHPVALADGRKVRLSDHHGVLADLVLRRGPPTPWRPDARRAAWSATAARARTYLRAQVAASRARASADRRWGLALLGLAVALFVWERRRAGRPGRRRGGCLLQALTLLALNLAVFSLYLGVVYEPHLAAGLQAALERL